MVGQEGEVVTKVAMYTVLTPSKKNIDQKRGSQQQQQQEQQPQPPPQQPPPPPPQQQQQQLNASFVKNSVANVLSMHPCLDSRSDEDRERDEQYSAIQNPSSDDLYETFSKEQQSSLPALSFEQSQSINNDQIVVKTDRQGRLRRWSAMAVFSLICAASATDAAINVSNKNLTLPQKYMLIWPAVSTLICAGIFVMCLFPVSYLFVDDFKFGGIFSLLIFFSWVCNLVIMTHSESSWAVNEIGDIKMANLYYFSWASILSAGLQMTYYVKKKLGIITNDALFLLWFTLFKVCFVVYGSGMHIQGNIRDRCDDETVGGGTDGNRITFCTRTAYAVWAGLMGMTISTIVMLSRILEGRILISQIPVQIRVIFEMVLASLIVLTFGLGAALVTGIGGPGQSVGDLYYATWLAFLVSLAVAGSCFETIRVDELHYSRNDQSNDDDLNNGVRGDNMQPSYFINEKTSDAPFVMMNN